MMSAQRRQGGFSLLEAIVSIVLLASLGLALFAWINSSVISLQHIRDANTESEATLNILEYMQSVNPMISPQGNADLGGYSFSWQAKLTTPILDGRGFSGGVSLWQFGMYDTDVSVRRDESLPWFEFQMKQVGYKRVRTLSSEP